MYNIIYFVIVWDILSNITIFHKSYKFINYSICIKHPSYSQTGDGPGMGLAWGCDLSYDYVKINAEYTT